MIRVIITIGVPASGKSTWAKELIAKDQSFARVNRDSIREMMGDRSVWYTEAFEVMVTKTQKRIVAGYLANKKNIVIDDTNTRRDTVSDIISWIQEYVDGNGYPVSFEQKVFNTPYEVCVERDKTRVATVGVDIIDKMCRSLKNGINAGWIKDSVEILTRTCHTPIDMTKPLAVLCDLDGTLAHIAHRDPYDAEKCLDDVVCETVANTLAMYSAMGYSVIIVSGRSDKYKDLSEQWLKNNNIKYSAIHMRMEGDRQKDSNLKKAIYKARIEPFYSVEVVLDDRDQVVDMWRRLGLKCYQVAYGDF